MHETDLETSYLRDLVEHQSTCVACVVLCKICISGLNSGRGNLLIIAELEWVWRWW